MLGQASNRADKRPSLGDRRDRTTDRLGQLSHAPHELAVGGVGESLIWIVAEPDTDVPAQRDCPCRHRQAVTVRDVDCPRLVRREDVQVGPQARR